MDPNEQINQQVYNEWHAQWEQDLFAQSLLNPLEPTSADVLTKEIQSEADQEADLQKLQKRFSHVDDNIVYSTYFEQTDCNLQESIKLLEIQFPEDPAFVAAKAMEDGMKIEERQKKEEEEKYNLNDEEIKQEQQILQPQETGAFNPSLNASELEFSEYHVANDVDKEFEVQIDGGNQRLSLREQHIDLSEDICREILMHLQIRLQRQNNNNRKAETAFFEILEIVHKLLNNIIGDPLDQRFHQVKLTNKKIQQYITVHTECINLFEVLGFQEKHDVVSQDQGLQVMLVIPQQTVLDQYPNLQKVQTIINELLSTKSIKTLTNHFDGVNKDGSSATPGGPNAAPMSKIQREKTIQKMANQKNNVRSRLLEAQFDRQERKATQPELVQQQRDFSNQQQNLDTYLGQLGNYRKMQQEKYRRRFGAARVITVNDLQQRIDQDTANRNRAQIGPNTTDSERWGIRALDLTNQFRASTSEGHEGNKPALAWNKQLHDIALEHSINMADGKVPFGHDGFNDRMRKVPFYVRSFSENVAYNYGCGDPVETAVRGWINSPGHRKNMLAVNTLCGIAVYCKYGKYWFTQLFALQ